MKKLKNTPMSEAKWWTIVDKLEKAVFWILPDKWILTSSTEDDLTVLEYE